MNRLARWGDVAQLRYGKSLRDYPLTRSERCQFRVFGTNGPVGWHESPLVAGPGIIIGRKGMYRGVHFSPEPFFVIDTAYYLNIHDPDVDLKWAFYQLLTVDINHMDSGSAIPSTKREDFNAVRVLIPTLPKQRKTADILSAYDALIATNRRRMELLEELTRRLYEEWFVRLRFPGHQHSRIINGLPEGWRRKPLGEILTLQRGHDLPGNQRVHGDVPVVSSSGTTGFHNQKKANGPGVVTGRYGTIGDVYYIDRDYWPLNTALCSRFQRQRRGSDFPLPERGAAKHTERQGRRSGSESQCPASPANHLAGETVSWSLRQVRPPDPGTSQQSPSPKRAASRGARPAFAASDERGD